MLYTKSTKYKCLQLFISMLIGVSAAISLPMKITDESVASNIATTTLLLNTVARQGAFASFLSFLFCTIIIYFSIDRLKKANFRENIILGICSILLSLTIILSSFWNMLGDDYPWYTASVNIPWDSTRFLCIFIFRWIFIAILLCGIFSILYSYAKKTALESVASKLKFQTKPVLLGTLFVYICWIPISIINGPAIIGVDAMVQLIQMRGFKAWDPMTMEYLDGFRLTDHHPFFDSYLYGLFDRIGLLLGNEIIGFVILIQLQLLIGAFSLILSLAWVNSRTHNGIPRFLMGAILIFIAFVPCFSMYLTVILKDSTWVPLFLIWSVLFAETIYQLKQKQGVGYKLLCLLILFAILSALTKKTSIYITTPSMLVLAVFYKNRVKLLIASVLPALLCLIVIPSFLFPVLKIAPGGAQEPLSVPIQQITKVLLDHQNELSDNELQTISKVLNIKEATKNYNPINSDNAKHYGYKTSSTGKDRFNFLVLWIQLFFKFPDSYLSSVTFLIEPYLIGDTYYYTSAVKCGWYEAGGFAILPEYGECTQSSLQKNIATPLINVLNRIPPFSFVGSESLYVAWIPVLSLGLCILKKRYKNLIYFTPVLFLQLCQFLVPTHQVRYSLGLLFTFMITSSIPFLCDCNSTSKSDSVSSKTFIAINKARDE